MVAGRVEDPFVPANVSEVYIEVVQAAGTFSVLHLVASERSLASRLCLVE